MTGLPLFTQICYLIAAALFILSLKWLSAPTTARRGVLVGEIGMGLAILGTLLMPEIKKKPRVAVRDMFWIGLTQRSISSTAVGMRLGSYARAAH